MARFVLLACLLGGCASVDGALPGTSSRADLSASADDLGAAGDLANGGGGGAGDGGASALDLGAADLATGCVASAHVVVNEVKTGGSAGLSDEFIELYNPCGSTINLAGSSLVYRSAAGTTDGVIINLTKTIAGGGYYLVAGPNYSNGGTPDQTYGGGRLAAAGGGVGLRDGAQVLVDSVGYGTATNAFVESAAAAAPPSGESIARTPNGADNDNNATDFAVATTPTPRAAN